MPFRLLAVACRVHSLEGPTILDDAKYPQLAHMTKGRPLLGPAIAIVAQPSSQKLVRGVHLLE